MIMQLSYLIMRKDAHQKFIDIIRLLTDLAEQYSLENYLTADYDILHECTDGLDNAICDLQEESGWLTAVRTLTSLSCTSAIACHIYKPVHYNGIEKLPEIYFAFAKASFHYRFFDYHHFTIISETYLRELLVSCISLSVTIPESLRLVLTLVTKKVIV